MLENAAFSILTLLAKGHGLEIVCLTEYKNINMGFDLSIIDLFYVFVPGAIYTFLWSTPIWWKSGISEELKSLGDSLLVVLFVSVSLFVGFFLQEVWILVKKATVLGEGADKDEKKDKDLCLLQRLQRFVADSCGVSLENKILHEANKAYHENNGQNNDGKSFKTLAMKKREIEKMKHSIIHPTNSHCWIEGKQQLIQNFGNRAAFWGTMFSGVLVTIITILFLRLGGISPWVLIIIEIILSPILFIIFYRENKKKEYGTVLNHWGILKKEIKRVKQGKRTKRGKE